MTNTHQDFTIQYHLPFEAQAGEPDTERVSLLDLGTAKDHAADMMAGTDYIEARIYDEDFETRTVTELARVAA